MLVFAYGSLLWRPGFTPKAAVRATAVGWSRRWCVRSTVHRGTERYPGIVLGLVEGGRCSGLLYSVESCDCGKVAEYLELREMAETGYRSAMIDVDTSDGRTKALTYVSDPRHRMDGKPYDLLGLIMRARGVSGSNAEYAAATFSALNTLGVGLTEQETGLPSEIVTAIVGDRKLRHYVADTREDYREWSSTLRAAQNSAAAKSVSNLSENSKTCR